MSSSDPSLRPPEVGRWGVERHTDLRAGLASADAIMMLRLQRERQTRNFFPSLDEYSRRFCLTVEALKEAKPNVIILHPGPINRGVEIDSRVADGPYSVILEQVTNGVAVRMAVLYLLTTQERLATREQSVPHAQAVGQEGIDMQTEPGAWDQRPQPDSFDAAQDRQKNRSPRQPERFLLPKRAVGQ